MPVALALQVRICRRNDVPRQMEKACQSPTLPPSPPPPLQSARELQAHQNKTWAGSMNYSTQGHSQSEQILSCGSKVAGENSLVSQGRIFFFYFNMQKTYRIILWICLNTQLPQKRPFKNTHTHVRIMLWTLLTWHTRGIYLHIHLVKRSRKGKPNWEDDQMDLLSITFKQTSQNCYC